MMISRGGPFFGEVLVKKWLVLRVFFQRNAVNICQICGYVHP